MRVFFFVKKKYVEWTFCKKKKKLLSEWDLPENFVQGPTNSIDILNHSVFDYFLMVN